MTAMVVFESMFGGTQAVAEAIGAGIASCGLPVDVVEVGRMVGAGEHEAWPVEDALLLAVGGPTHLRTLSSERTRATARSHGTVVSALTGLDHWLTVAGPVVRGRPVAAFDTSWGTQDAGSAAAVIARRLEELEGRLVAPARTFLVTGESTGPSPAELEQAWEWGRGLVARLA
ncbi:flavodoxin/nitric oxide synthase [Cellulomonas fimi]|uniref:Flavodoxin/nitric oxide synthase n=1 Tax=Cellulomonas fimi (strain ATCC 484 / DSM 20113 / JCM 1341 / CCUG 24087 / LMG 16345 / NBRC 15513 / NCIMB 8980 / NCTC 7547 / NRS-133) TaxID=590998 RepID=F4H0U8_CELFA|nr:flavodoxin/nitric oxide synthase [Cellulomonas fimi]AEE46195.1 flavodoxin/nitric oxide synthase [Cellulomonas fimi ATCC 484]NNH08564.1 flavodoxin [Cellulomonas fimi]VEH32010.1 Uncharacterised protein [Cellulomonas fimi]